MAGKSLTQKIDELTEKVHQMEITFERHRTVTEFRVQTLEAQEAEHKRTEDELKQKVADLTTKNAALEERARNQERRSDRGFSFAQAAIISVVAAGLSLLAQVAVKRFFPS